MTCNTFSVIVNRIPGQMQHAMGSVNYIGCIALTAAITAISTMEFPMYCETGPLTDVQQVHVSLILFSYYLICIFLHLNIYEIGKRGK